MVLAMIALPLLMDEDTADTAEPRGNYLELMRSLVGLAAGHPRVMLSGVIQGLSFSIFLATWLGIGLYLTGDSVGLGTDVVGYLAACSAIGLLTTPRLGRWADRLGPERARLRMALAQFAAVASLGLAALHWQLLLIPVLATAVSGPLIDITGRMTSLSQPAAIRTRLMSIYITLMFIGAGLGSWLGTIAYDAGGWWGTVALTVALSTGVCLLSWTAARGVSGPAGNA
jgi:predicted MFS family arabinose efflux permease